MANQRLGILMKKADVQYAEGSPILLEACALYRDNVTNSCIAQLKWKNIDSHQIRAIMIELDVYDTFNQKLAPVHYQYDGLSAPQGAEFGEKTPIIIPGTKTVKYNVLLKAVSFSDETVWRSEKNDSFVTLPASKPQEFEEELLGQLKRDLAKQGNTDAASYSPQNAMGLWQCGCGSWQYAASPCLKCGITQAALEDLSDEAVLDEHLAAYKEEQERLRLEAEQRAKALYIAREKAAREYKEKKEAERLQRERQAQIAAEEAALRRASHRKRVIIRIIVLIALAVAAYFTVTSIQKSNKYNHAAALMNMGRFDEARTTLTELGDYKDCFLLLKQVDADKLWSENRYAAAYDIYSTLPAAYQTHAVDYKKYYDAADAAEKEGDYERACSIFSQLGKYKDSAARSDAAELLRKKALAEHYKSAGQYGEARNIYLELGIEDQALECLYLLADFHAASQPWLAYDEFIAAGDYKDSAQQASALYSKRYKQINSADANGLRTFYDPKTEGYGLLDSKADVVVNPDYASLAINENKAYTVKAGGRFGVIDSTGKAIIPIEYDSINAKGGNYYVEKNSLHGIFKPDGTVLIPVEYDSIYIQGTQYEVAKGGKEGVLSSDGSIILPADYESVQKLKDGRYYISVNKKYGIVDETGKIIIEPKYSSITYTNTNTYTVVSDGKYGIIKYDGTVAHETNMEWVGAGSNDGRFLMFKENGMFGFMDASTFAVTVPAEWKEATIMTDGYAYIRNKLDNWGVIDSRGTVTVSPQWKYITYYKDCGYAARSKDGSESWNQYYLMDNCGQLICNFKNGEVEYLENGTFRNTRGNILYSIAAKTSYAYTVNNWDVTKMNLLGSDLLSGYYWKSSFKGSCYGVISISQKKVLSNQPWELEIKKIPSRNEVDGKYGWIGADGKDLVSPTYDFMDESLVNGYIVAAKYNARGDLVYELINPTTGSILVKNISSKEKAYNFGGKNLP